MGFLEDQANAWWDSLPADRRIQLFRWVDQGKSLPPPEVTGQQPIPFHLPKSKRGKK